MGIHYDYKAKRGERAMMKEAKRKARLAQRRAKRSLSSESEEKGEIKTGTIVLKKNISECIRRNLHSVHLSVSGGI